MDIQEMVDARIRELNGQPGSAAPVSQPHLAKDPGGFRDCGDILEFGEIVDGTLSEISSRVLDITEQVSGDYARLEKELLKSRLDLLRSAEIVLDMALSLKKQTRLLMATSNISGFRDADGEDSLMEMRRPQGRIDRASLYNDGVADLFRRT